MHPNKHGEAYDQPSQEAGKCVCLQMHPNKHGEAYNQPTQEAGKCVCLLINIRAVKFSNLLLTEDIRLV